MLPEISEGLKTEDEKELDRFLSVGENRFILVLLWYLAPGPTERMLTGIYFLIRYLPKFMGGLGFISGILYLYASGLYDASPSEMFKEHWWLLPFFFQAMGYFVGRVIVWGAIYVFIFLPFFLFGIFLGFQKAGTL
jgi:hypothetical protein